MPVDLWGKEFRAQVVASNYPFDEDATLVTDSGLLFDPGSIADAVFYPQGTWETLGMTAIDRGVESTSIWFGNDLNDRIFSASLDLRNIPEAVTLYDAYSRPVGTLTLDPASLSVLQTWPIAVHSFADGAANLVAFVLHPSPEEGLRGIATEAGDLHADHVRLLGDSGIVLTTNVAQTEIQVNAVGDPLFRRRSCLASGDYVTPSYLKSINGIGPDPFGGFVFVASSLIKGSTILRIDPSGTDTIVLSVAGGQVY